MNSNNKDSISSTVQNRKSTIWVSDTEQISLPEEEDDDDFDDNGENKHGKEKQTNPLTLAGSNTESMNSSKEQANYDQTLFVKHVILIQWKNINGFSIRHYDNTY